MRVAGRRVEVVESGGWVEVFLFVDVDKSVGIFLPVAIDDLVATLIVVACKQWGQSFSVVEAADGETLGLSHGVEREGEGQALGAQPNMRQTRSQDAPVIQSGRWIEMLPPITSSPSGASARNRQG
jgi:hypothetical protein